MTEKPATLLAEGVGREYLPDAMIEHSSRTPFCNSFKMASPFWGKVRQVSSSFAVKDVIVDKKKS
jgi:hypothetical protein